MSETYWVRIGIDPQGAKDGAREVVAATEKVKGGFRGVNQESAQASAGVTKLSRATVGLDANAQKIGQSLRQLAGASGFGGLVRQGTAAAGVFEGLGVTLGIAGAAMLGVYYGGKNAEAILKKLEVTVRDLGRAFGATDAQIEKFMNLLTLTPIVGFLRMMADAKASLRSLGAEMIGGPTTQLAAGTLAKAEIGREMMAQREAVRALDEESRKLDITFQALSRSGKLTKDALAALWDRAAKLKNEYGDLGREGGVLVRTMAAQKEAQDGITKAIGSAATAIDEKLEPTIRNLHEIDTFWLLSESIRDMNEQLKETLELSRQLASRGLQDWVGQVRSDIAGRTPDMRSGADEATALARYWAPAVEQTTKELAHLADLSKRFPQFQEEIAKESLRVQQDARDKIVALWAQALNQFADVLYAMGAFEGKAIPSGLPSGAADNRAAGRGQIASSIGGIAQNPYNVMAWYKLFEGIAIAGTTRGGFHGIADVSATGGRAKTDIMNIQGTKEMLAHMTDVGGAITAAAFLRQFVKDPDGEDAYPWVHIDIAPRMTTIEGEHLAKGAAGASIALLVHFLRSS